MTTDDDNQLDDAAKPHPFFLIGAIIFTGGAVATYTYEDAIIAASGNDNMSGFLFLLIISVLGAALMLLCYRVPRIGNRLIGYDILLRKSSPRDNDGSFSYGAGFKSESGSDAKRQNSRRKHHRADRRHYAKITRDMQAGQTSASTDTSDPLDKDDPSQ